jgi:hypothetical protein
MSHYKRAIELQSRDFRLLRCLLESRLMTRAHAAALVFHGRREAAKKRIQKLKAAGLITERRAKTYQPNQPRPIHLSKPGVAALRAHGAQISAMAFQPPRAMSDAAISRHLKLIDIKVAFTHDCACESDGELLEFALAPSHDLTVSSAPSARRLAVRPDAFIHIRSADQHHRFFLDLVRPTASQRAICERVEAYREHYHSGGFAEALGLPASEYMRCPFRVLLVFQSPEMLRHTAIRLTELRKPILRQAWLTTASEATANPVGCIWVTPLAYRRAASAACAKGPSASHHSTDTLILPKDEPAKESLLGNAREPSSRELLEPQRTG